MRKYVPALLLLAVAFAIPSEALAQRGSSSVQFTPFVGYRFANTLNPNVEVGGNLITESVTLKDGISYGFIIDIPLNDYVAIEGLWSRRTADIEVAGVMPAHVVGEGSAQYFHGGAKITFNPYSRGAKWFVAGTLGVAQFGTELENVESQSKFSFGFGAGVTFPFSDNIGLRTEFRGFSTRTDLTSLGWICGYYTCGLVEGNQYFWEGELRAGLQIGF